MGIDHFVCGSCGLINPRVNGEPQQQQRAVDRVNPNPEGGLLSPLFRRMTPRLERNGYSTELYVGFSYTPSSFLRLDPAYVLAPQAWFFFICICKEASSDNSGGIRAKGKMAGFPLSSLP
jgi:hypothetical protein